MLSDEDIQGAWHDVTCPEGPQCRSRDLHLRSPVAGPLIVQFGRKIESLIEIEILKSARRGELDDVHRRSQ